MSDRGTWVVSKDAWHYKLYHMWETHGGANQRGYKENLCHYWRVVLFWSMSRWFLHHEFRGKDWLRPVSIFAAVAVTTGLGAVAYFNPVDFLIGAVFVIGVVGAAIGLVFLQEYVSATQERKDRFADGALNTGAVVFFPIWAPIFVLVKFFSLPPFVAFARGVSSAFWWFVDFIMDKTIFKVPLAVYMGFGFLCALWYGGYRLIGTDMIKFTIIGVVGAITLCSIVYAMIEWLAPPIGRWWRAAKIRRRERREARLLAASKAREAAGPPPTPTYKLAWGGIVAKKHKICPFVEIAGDDQ